MLSILGTSLLSVSMITKSLFGSIGGRVLSCELYLKIMKLWLGLTVIRKRNYLALAAGDIFFLSISIIDRSSYFISGSSSAFGILWCETCYPITYISSYP
jgi:hypothetical protein